MQRRIAQSIRTRKSRDGFTLLEMIISIGLFAILVILVIGVMLGVSKAQGKTANIQAIQDNLRFGMELFAKELRTGLGYQLVSKCGSIGQGLEFIGVNQGQPKARLYYLADTDANGTADTLMRVALDTPGPVQPSDCASAIPFTADEILVKNLIFSLQGANPGPDDGQPRVTISMEVETKDPKAGTETSMSLQTTITQRLRDF